MEFLGDELASLADTLRQDQPSSAWLRDYEFAARSGEGLSAAAVCRLLSAAEAIGRQRLSAEVGTDELAGITSQAGVVAANMLAAVPQTRTLRAILRALRGYALLLWTAVHLATSEGRFGPRVVGFAVTAGSAAIALSVFTPNVPIIVVLLGVALVMAGATAGALLTPHGRPIGRRLALPAAAAAAALIAYGIHNKHNLFHDDLLLKTAAVVALILVGSYVGRIRRPRKQS